MEQKNTNEEKLTADFPVAKLLEPLKKKPCLKIVKGWWTYEFCFMESLRQYHTEDGEAVGEILSLGSHGSDFDWTDEQKIKAKMFKKKRIQKYHTQYYVNGTECSVISHKRDSEVRYYCDESASVPYIERVDEPSTCSYIVTIKTNLLCSHPSTRITYKSKPVEVLCQPLLSSDSYQAYMEQQAKAELTAYEETKLLLKQKRDRLRKLLLSLKKDAQSDPTAPPTDDKAMDPSSSSLAGEEQISDESEEAPKVDLKELAIDFIQRFAPEEKFNNLESSGQAKLLESVIQLMTQFKTLPTADLARLIRFEILSFIERKDAFSSDFLLGMLRGITPATSGFDKVKHTSRGTVHIKFRTMSDSEEDVHNQDPEVEELEKEIENELAEAGVTSKRDIEVHLIRPRGSAEKLSDLDTQHFKEVLIEIMGGTAIEDREKERFKRLMDNYNILYKDSIATPAASDDEKDESLANA